MVIRLPEQCETQLKGEFIALDSDTSEKICSVPGTDSFYIWRCSVKGVANAIGYWIGTNTVHYAYIVLYRFMIPEVEAYEVKRVWVDPQHRRKGFFSILMQCATSNNEWLVSDSDGMTEASFKAWENTSLFKRHFFDNEKKIIVKYCSVPVAERFDWVSQASRWLLVLEPI